MKELSGQVQINRDGASAYSKTICSKHIQLPGYIKPVTHLINSILPAFEIIFFLFIKLYSI
jgi:hypothetical protein